MNQDMSNFLSNCQGRLRQVTLLDRNHSDGRLVSEDEESNGDQLLVEWPSDQEQEDVPARTNDCEPAMKPVLLDQEGSVDDNMPTKLEDLSLHDSKPSLSPPKVPTNNKDRRGTTTRSTRDLSVRFSKSNHVFHYETKAPLYELTYSREEQHGATRDAVLHARIIRRFLKSAALSASINNESSSIASDSTTGLPSPHTLQEHLPCPEEIVGIEHLLRGEKVARACLALKRYHTRSLLEEQQRCWDEARVAMSMGMGSSNIMGSSSSIDSACRFAHVLEKSSSVSLKLAKGRADYVARLD